MSKPRTRFTKHALDKFNILRQYGFPLKKQQVLSTVLKPDRLEDRDNQVVATKVLNKEYGIRVVYEIRGDQMVIITFYPVRRDRYGI